MIPYWKFILGFSMIVYMNSYQMCTAGSAWVARMHRQMETCIFSHHSKIFVNKMNTQNPDEAFVVLLINFSGVWKCLIE